MARRVFLKYLLEEIIHLFDVLHDFSGCSALQTKISNDQ
jgi:hypothetical protein